MWNLDYKCKHIRSPHACTLPVSRFPQIIHKCLWVFPQIKQIKTGVGLDQGSRRDEGGLSKALGQCAKQSLEPAERSSSPRRTATPWPAGNHWGERGLTRKITGPACFDESTSHNQSKTRNQGAGKEQACVIYIYVIYFHAGSERVCKKEKESRVSKPWIISCVSRKRPKEKLKGKKEKDFLHMGCIGHSWKSKVYMTLWALVMRK